MLLQKKRSAFEQPRLAPATVEFGTVTETDDAKDDPNDRRRDQNGKTFRGNAMAEEAKRLNAWK
jgi:hypothetical protein